MKSKYTEAKIGTNIYGIIQMLKRPEGVSTQELIDIGLIKHLNIGPIFNDSLPDQHGYDIRQFPSPENRRNRAVRGPKGYVYKIVGRHNWDGTYVDYIAEDLA